MAQATRDRLRRLIPTPRREWCECPEPMLDSLVGLDGDDEECWRCRRPVKPDDEEAAE